MSISKILYKNFVKVSSILTTTKRKPYITINICKLHILYNLLKPIFLRKLSLILLILDVVLHPQEDYKIFVFIEYSV